jgi:hypothetical protein
MVQCRGALDIRSGLLEYTILYEAITDDLAYVYQA